MTATNPFTQIKTAIRSYLGAHWDSLDADNPAKVKVANRFRRLLKDNVQPADLPEVDIRSAEGGRNQFTASSGTGLFQRTYELGIASDDKDASDVSLDQAEWEILRAASKAQQDKLGLSGLVVNVEIDNTRQTKDDAELNRGHKRWSGAVTLVVTFQVPRADLIPTV